MKTLNPRATLLFLLLVTGALYLTLLNAPPLNWDDDSNIFANPFYRAGVWSEFWSHAYFGLYVPVTSTLWQILFALGGGRAWPYRVLNVGLHVANVALVYHLVRRRASAPASALGAAVFALHPLQTATVAWISGGRDLLAGFFALASVALGVRGWRPSALVTFALAGLSKPSVVTLPLVAPLLDPLRVRVVRRELGPWIAAALVLSALMILATLGAQAGHLPDVRWWQRPWLIGDTYWFYLTRLTGIPPLAANYARTPAWVFAHPSTLATAAIPYALLAYLLVRRPSGAGLAGAAALALAPVSGIVSFGYQNISGVADHYAYLVLAPVAGLIAAAADRWRGRTFWGLLMLIALVGLGLKTVRRLDVWRSNDAFFTDMARTAPDSYATAIGMSSVACAERRDFDDGVRWTEVALRARPLDVRALANQAYCLLHANRPAAVAELDFYLDRMDLDALERNEPTGYASLLASIGSALITLDQNEDGYEYLCEAARILPDDPTHRRNLVVATALLRKRHVEPKCEDPGT